MPKQKYRNEAKRIPEVHVNAGLPSVWATFARAIYYCMWVMLCGITESCVFVSRFCHHSRLNKCCQCMDCGTFVNICLYFICVRDGWSRKLDNLRTSRISVSCAVETFTEFLYRWIAIKSITGRYCTRMIPQSIKCANAIVASRPKHTIPLT